jgi:hypothetical protein
VKGDVIALASTQLPGGHLEPQRHAGAHPRLFQRLRLLQLWPSDTPALGRLHHAMAAAERNRHQARQVVLSRRSTGQWVG